MEIAHLVDLLEPSEVVVGEGAEWVAVNRHGEGDRSNRRGRAQRIVGEAGERSHLALAGLRERRHLETKRLLVETAFDLFVERGFANVSMEEVAQAGGVSRSTLYRRFPAKEDLVLDVPEGWLVVFDHAIEALPLDASIGDAIGEPVLAVAAHIDQNKEIVRTAYEILGQSPTLQQSGLATTTWLGRITAIFERFSATDTETSLVLAGAYFGAIDAMMLDWAKAGTTSSMTERTTRLLARLAPILPPDRTG